MSTDGTEYTKWQVVQEGDPSCEHDPSNYTKLLSPPIYVVTCLKCRRTIQRTKRKHVWPDENE